MCQKYMVGIDVGATSVKLGLFDAEGVLIEKQTFFTASDIKSVAKESAHIINALLCKYGIARCDLLGIGLGVPGLVDYSGVMHGCVNLGWGDVKAAEVFESCCQIPTIAQNDANAAALGEYWRGAGKGHGSMFMLTLGTGVGGAAVINGRLWKGAHGGGGEVGHICVNPKEKEPCSCKNYGCLEQYASATGLVRIYTELLRQSCEKPAAQNIKATAEGIFKAYSQGDDIAQKAVFIMAEKLALGIADITAIFDPETVVLGGGLSLAGAALLDNVKKYYPNFAYKDMRDTPIALSKLGADAGMIGCAYLAKGEI